LPTSSAFYCTCFYRFLKIVLAGADRNDIFSTLPNFNQLEEPGFRVSAGAAGSYAVAATSPAGSSAYSPSGSVYAASSGGISAPLPTPAGHAGARDLPEIETLNVELCKDNQGKTLASHVSLCFRVVDPD
jgi:hypothetical protein